MTAKKYARRRAYAAAVIKNPDNQRREHSKTHGKGKRFHETACHLRHKQEGRCICK